MLSCISARIRALCASEYSGLCACGEHVQRIRARTELYISDPWRVTAARTGFGFYFAGKPGAYRLLALLQDLQFPVEDSGTGVSLEMPAFMGFAIGGQNSAIWACNELKHRNPESLPEKYTELVTDRRFTNGTERQNGVIYTAQICNSQGGPLGCPLQIFD